MTGLHSNLQTLFVWIVGFGVGIGIVAALKAGRITTALLMFLGLGIAAAFVFVSVPQMAAFGHSMWALLSNLTNGKVA
jgi:hypothetical protein